MSFKVQNLSFEYQDKNPRNKRSIFNDVNFIIKENQLNFLVGPNGSGKTTLALLLAGLLKPTNKETVFSINNQIIKQKHLIKKIGYIFQNPTTQLLHLKVLEELIFPLKSSPQLEIKINNYLNILNIDKNILLKKSEELSYGQMKLILIIHFLISEKEVIIIDEPVINFDFETKEWFWKNIKLLVEETSKIILILDNDINNIKKYSDSFLLIKDKQIFTNDIKKLIKIEFYLTDEWLSFEEKIAKKINKTVKEIEDMLDENSKN